MSYCSKLSPQDFAQYGNIEPMFVGQRAARTVTDQDL
jgi:hypothetical protein